MSTERRHAKRKVFDEWMQEDHVLVHLDSRVSGVQVPSHLAGNPALCLKLSYQFQGETTVDDAGIITWLKFNGNYNECVLPWDSIWGITSAESNNRVWTEDMPPELLKELAVNKLKEMKDRFFGKKNAEASTEPASPAASEKPKPSLKRVK